MTGHVDALEQLGSELLALAAARGWAVAPWWAGGCAGSAPDTPRKALTRVELLGRHHETNLLGEERRTRGTHLTPAQEALELTQRVIERSGAVSSVLDPCCAAVRKTPAPQLLHHLPDDVWRTEALGEELCIGRRCQRAGREGLGSVEHREILCEWAQTLSRIQPARLQVRRTQ